jgi:FkbM family methyltransferase
MIKLLKCLIRNFLNKNNFEIIKQEYIGDILNNLSKDKNEYLCNTKLGKFYLPPNPDIDPVSKCISRGRLFEEKILEESLNYIQEDSIVLDIGANFGQMSLFYSKKIKSCMVYAFEAQKEVFNLLKKTVEANNISNIKLFYNAVYNKDGVDMFFDDLDFDNQVSYSNIGVSEINRNNKVGIKSITIDTALKDISKKVSFIKVDIQGADLFALEGAINIININRPVILFEFEEQFQEKFNTKFNDYVKFVNKINYRFEKTINNINYLIVPNER